jgi:hypothetical protein
MDEMEDDIGTAGNSKTFVPAKRGLSSASLEQAQLGSSGLPDQAPAKKPRKTQNPRWTQAVNLVLIRHLYVPKHMPFIF